MIVDQRHKKRQVELTIDYWSIEINNFLWQPSWMFVVYV
jgi:hypothetical protein